MTQPFCCDITSGTKEEQNEFKRLFNKSSKKNWGYGTIYYGVDKYGVFDCGSDINGLQIAVRFNDGYVLLPAGAVYLVGF